LEPRDPPGNPVFELHAGFRRSAGLAQKVLLLGGPLLALACGVAWLCKLGGAEAAPLYGYGAALGGVLLIAGVLWGFWWRRWLRREFRKRYGSI